MLCRDCKHWKAMPLKMPGWGKCELAELTIGLMRPVKHQPMNDATDQQPVRYTDEFAGRLLTHAYFGCVQAEAKPRKRGGDV